MNDLRDQLDTLHIHYALEACPVKIGDRVQGPDGVRLGLDGREVLVQKIAPVLYASRIGNVIKFDSARTYEVHVCRRLKSGWAMLASRLHIEEEDMDKLLVVGQDMKSVHERDNS
jgi:hypothetical protein